MKLFLFTSALCSSLVLFLSQETLAEDLSEGTVAQRIIKAEGYWMSRFDPAEERSYQLVVRYQGKETPLVMPASKKYIVTIQTEDGSNSLKSVRVDAANGATMSMAFPAKTFGAFQWSVSSSAVVLNDPFLKLGGPDGELQVVVTPRAND